MSEVATKQAVAVWEWENKYGRWRPYTPEVCQQLERSFNKGLKSVYLGDSDPSLSKFIVYLQPCLQQECINSGTTWRVRRELYCPNSPPGKGICWKWSGDSEGSWHTYGTAVQCFIEDAYMRGEQTLDVSRVFPTTPYIINFCNMTQVRCNTGFVRNTERIQIQSYPLVKVSASEPLATDHMTASLAFQLTGGSCASTASADGHHRSKKKGSKGDKDHHHHHHRSSKSNKRGSDAEGHSSNAGILMGGENARPPPPPEQRISGALASAAKAKEFLRRLTSISSGKSHHDRQQQRGKGDDGARSQFGSPASVSASAATEASSAPSRARGVSQRSQKTSGGLLERRPSLDTISTYLSLDSTSTSTRRKGGDRAGSASSSRYSQSIASPSYLSSAASDDVFLDAMEEAMSDMCSRNLLRGPQQLFASPDLLGPVPGANAGMRWAGNSHNGLEGSSVPFLESVTTPVKEIVDPRDACVICCEPLAAASAYDVGAGRARSHVVALNVCRHPLHWNCLRAMQRSNKLSYVQCPNCSCVHGEKRGNQPPGEMNHSVLHESLPGHEDCNTIVVTYSIFPGVQGMNHPCPGKPYVVRGFPKKCYLPNNQKGKRVLSLLYKAWSRGLIFTIGSACTTGEPNVVVWNGIHHKTEKSGGPPTGYPDPFYLDNVVIELRAHSVE